MTHHSSSTDQSVVPTVDTLYRLFDGLPPRWQGIGPETTPEPYRSLLAHHEHMTVTLERYHRTFLDLVVLEARHSGDWYARKILLLHERTRRVVQFGIMRFDLRACDQEVRTAILEQRTPLGRILIQHDVLRRLDMHEIVNLQPDAEIRRHFGLSAADDRAVFGRLATITCNQQPAVDLLEILPLED